MKKGMKTMPTSSDIKSTLTDFIEEVWNSGIVDASDKYIAPKYTVHHDPGDPWDKQELDLTGYKERVRKSRAPFPDHRFRIQNLLAEGDVAIMTWLWSATHLGDLPGFPATGNHVTMSGATAYYFDKGRLTGHWQVTDRLGVYLQLRQGSAHA
jgi:predicted ester cyclase